MPVGSPNGAAALVRNSVGAVLVAAGPADGASVAAPVLPDPAEGAGCDEPDAGVLGPGAGAGAGGWTGRDGVTGCAGGAGG